jgi:hypothetical protein
VFVFAGLVTCLDLDKEGIVLSDLEEVCPWFLWVSLRSQEEVSLVLPPKRARACCCFTNLVQ